GQLEWPRRTVAACLPVRGPSAWSGFGALLLQAYWK
ncbi:MAG: hypothetical protein ACI841_003493, partial [Planctomycetota bacterium]